MKSIRIGADGAIRLPRDILKLFPVSTELAVWIEEDTIILKQIRRVKASQIAGKAPAEEMPLEEISEEIHKMRKGE